MAINYFARVWDDDETWQHQYRRNCLALVTAAVLALTVARFTSYTVEHILLSNFPSVSKQYCFSDGTHDTTKLERTLLKMIKIAAAVAFLCRWPIGLIVPIHLWESVFFATGILVVVELSFVALLSLLVGFIRVAHHAALTTGWEHPDSPVRAFPAIDYSKEPLQFKHRSVMEDSIKGSYDDTSVTEDSFVGKADDTSINGKVVLDASPKLIDTTDSFIRFSPAALSSSTWLKTRSFANSIFSNSTQSTSSRDSFGGPSLGRSSSLNQAQNASDFSEVPDLLTGTPRRRFA